jgi:hypothetical protein
MTGKPKRQEYVVHPPIYWRNDALWGNYISRIFFLLSALSLCWHKMLRCANSNGERPFSGRHLLLKKLPDHLAVETENKAK